MSLGELQRGFTQRAGGRGGEGCVRLLLVLLLVTQTCALAGGLREEPRARGPAGPHWDGGCEKEPVTQVPYLTLPN